MVFEDTDHGLGLKASYSGSYYLPALSCEAMYDRGIYARKKGKVVEVVKKVIQ